MLLLKLSIFSTKRCFLYNYNDIILDTKVYSRINNINYLKIKKKILFLNKKYLNYK